MELINKNIKPENRNQAMNPSSEIKQERIRDSKDCPISFEQAESSEASQTSQKIINPNPEAIYEQLRQFPEEFVEILKRSFEEINENSEDKVTVMNILSDERLIASVDEVGQREVEDEIGERVKFLHEQVRQQNRKIEKKHEKITKLNSEIYDQGEQIKDLEEQLTEETTKESETFTTVQTEHEIMANLSLKKKRMSELLGIQQKDQQELEQKEFSYDERKSKQGQLLGLKKKLGRQRKQNKIIREEIQVLHAKLAEENQILKKQEEKRRLNKSDKNLEMPQKYEQPQNFMRIYLLILWCVANLLLTSMLTF